MKGPKEQAKETLAASEQDFARYVEVVMSRMENGSLVLKPGDLTIIPTILRGVALHSERLADAIEILYKK